MATLHFTENEATWLVEPDLLPEEIINSTLQPHIFVQGYRLRPAGEHPNGDHEESVRYIGGSRQAFHRFKQQTFTGIRDKRSSDMRSLRQAETMLRRMPKVAIKFRYLWVQKFSDGDRQWMIDYRPLTNDWAAETEFKTAAAMNHFRDHPESWPAFITEDVTTDKRGYTFNQARKLREPELNEWIEVSKLAGTKTQYDPKPESDTGGSGDSKPSA